MTETQAQRILAPFMDAIRDCLEHGWTQWDALGRDNRAYRLELSKAARARAVYDHVVARANAVFAGRKGVNLVDMRGFLGIEIGGTILLRFKKLNGRLRFSGIPTMQQQLFTEQQPLQQSLFNFQPMTYVVAGYVLDRFEQSIVRMAIACWSGDVLNWSLDLPASGAGGVLPMPVTSGGTPPSAPRVAAKGRRREGTAKKAQ